MSHLPECWLSEGKFDALCMCDRLRACEERLRQGWCVSSCGNTHYTIGYEEGLDAAREAVAGLDSSDLIYEADALAAIDALREKP